MNISVIIPVFNTESYLCDCINSLIAQTIFNNMEIILVDDGSTDGSPIICDEYADKHKNIKVVHKSNSGVSAARNTGLDVAHGEFVGFVDSDDTVFPDMYRLLYEASDKTGADMAFCGIEHPYPDKDVVIKYPFENNILLDKEYIKNTIAPFMLADSSFNSLCNKLFKRSVIEKNGLRLSDGKKQGEDRELVLRFMLACGGVCGVDYVGYFYRYVKTSAVQKPRYDYADTIFEQFVLDRELFMKLGVENEVFYSLATVSVMSDLLCSLTFANKKLKGKTKKGVMRSIIYHSETQTLIAENYELLMTKSTRFDTLLIKMIRKKSIVGLRFIILLMKIKVSVYNMVKGGVE